MQTAFLDMYMKLVLNAKERPPQALGEAFLPLFMHMEHEDFKTILVPSCVKMLKRNPEIVLESISSLIKSVNLDLSKYAMEFFPVVLSQARHADEDRRAKALNIIGLLSQKSSDPDTLPSMFDAIKAIIGGKLYSFFYCIVWFGCFLFIIMFPGSINENRSLLSLVQTCFLHY
jgi:hypothetical protein